MSVKNPREQLESVKSISLVKIFFGYWLFNFGKFTYLFWIALFIFIGMMLAFWFIIFVLELKILNTILLYFLVPAIIYSAISDKKFAKKHSVLQEKMIHIFQKIVSLWNTPIMVKIKNFCKNIILGLSQRGYLWIRRIIIFVLWVMICNFSPEMGIGILLIFLLLKGIVLFSYFSSHPRKGSFFEECVLYSKNFYQYISQYNNENLDDTLIDEMALAIKIYNENFLKLEKILSVTSKIFKKHKILLESVQNEKIRASYEMGILLKNLEKKFILYKQKLLLQIAEIENIQKTQKGFLFSVQKFRLEAQLKNFENLEKMLYAKL